MTRINTGCEVAQRACVTRVERWSSNPIQGSWLFWPHLGTDTVLIIIFFPSLLHCITHTKSSTDAFDLRPRALHVPKPGTSGDDAFRKVQDSVASGPASVIGRRMGIAARAALWPLLVIPSPSSVRASLVLRWREEGANRGPDPVPRGHYF